MKFIKNNILLFSSVMISVLILALLMWFYINQKNQNTELFQSIESYSNELNSINNNSSSLSFVQKDLEEANNDSDKLVDTFKSLKLYYDSLLNSGVNLFINPKHKSSTAVNAKITRLFTQLSNSCKKSNIKLGASVQTPSFGLVEPSNENAEKFGFGFDRYDGFWPSFSENEVLILGVQADIVKLIVENLCSSIDNNNSARLLEIARESAGSIDAQNIGTNLFRPTEDEIIKLYRKADGVTSLLFQIKMEANTKVIRRFINKCRHPLLLCDLSIASTSANKSPSSIDSLNPFNINEQNAYTPDNVPVVSVVDSVAVLTFEYITGVNFNFDEVLSKFSSDPNNVFAKNFLKRVGINVLLEKND